MSTIKNGKYSDAEASRLASYDHPEYGPNVPTRAQVVKGGFKSKGDRANYLDNLDVKQDQSKDIQDY